VVRLRVDRRAAIVACIGRALVRAQEIRKLPFGRLVTRLEALTMSLRSLAIRWNDNHKRHRASRPQFERLEDRTVLAAPTVTGLVPTVGPEAGGTLVTITGTSFTGATAVNFGATAATNLNVVNDTTMTADSPAGTGTVDVTVTNADGTSPTSASD